MLTTKDLGTRILGKGESIVGGLGVRCGVVIRT